MLSDKQKKSKFEFNEIVKIKTSDSEKIKLNSKEGRISGKSEDDEGQWSYAVLVFDLGTVWFFEEYELEKTGEFVPKGFNRTGETIRVVVNEKGEGEIKDDSV